MDKKQIEELKQRVLNQSRTAHVHVPYSEVRNEEPDFEVRYLLDPEPALAVANPGQGMRSDFLYAGDDPAVEGIHMIWPEFLDEEGNVICDKNIEPAKTGNAYMWIGPDEKVRSYHRARLKVGTHGYWVVGSKRLAKVEVTRLIRLARGK